MPTLTRRGFVLGTSSILCNAHVVFAKSADKKKGISKAQWMAAVMVSAKASDDPLYLGRVREEMYFLLQPITWKPNPDQAPKFEPVVVPAGFVTDLASIPRIFFSALRPDGVYAYAAIVHD